LFDSHCLASGRATAIRGLVSLQEARCHLFLLVGHQGCVKLARCTCRLVVIILDSAATSVVALEKARIEIESVIIGLFNLRALLLEAVAARLLDAVQRRRDRLDIYVQEVEGKGKNDEEDPGHGDVLLEEEADIDWAITTKE
jgi:hypothetical protein